jgi:(2Fe-2S) ferredoxin
MNDTVGGEAPGAAKDEPLFYRKHVFVCLNERAPGHPRGCCKEKGSVEMRGYMKQRVSELKVEGVRINQALCLDRCELGPNMVIYPEGTWYTFANQSDIDEIIETHLVRDDRVERLMLGVDESEPRE